jgi:hypothetical protein
MKTVLAEPFCEQLETWLIGKLIIQPHNITTLNCETAGENARNNRSRAAISDLHEPTSLCRQRALQMVPFMDYAMAEIPNLQKEFGPFGNSFGYIQTIVFWLENRIPNPPNWFLPWGKLL